jgi:signal transduction histidine kinase
MMQGRSPAAAYPDEDAPEAPDVALDVALDDVLRHLVTSHEARGLAVHWEPSGLRAAGDADELAEVVNVLLSNARRHGAREVWLEARPAAGCVELTCSDDGPGVAEELRARLFDSGVRGADSPGQGLGLAIARRHLTERGGSLELGDSTVHPGATFVARLPISEMADAHHAA